VWLDDKRSLLCSPPKQWSANSKAVARNGAMPQSLCAMFCLSALWIEMNEASIHIYFSDFFGVSDKKIERYGAFNISLVTDLPLFIDPFLLFNSRKKKYKTLHHNIIRYLRFLKGKSTQTNISLGSLKSWYYFGEVKQTWLGFCGSGNSGRGLGKEFAVALNSSLQQIFSDFGREHITKGSHLEKLCLIKDGVGRDTISDFTTNLIKGFLLDYTQEFASKYLKPGQWRRVAVDRVIFNYSTQTWEPRTYRLPFVNGEYVLLTPRDILTKDDTWINKTDFIRDFDDIPDAIPNEQLREQINNYFLSLLPRKAKQKNVDQAVRQVALRYPQIIDYYIKYKELNGEKAADRNLTHVRESQDLYVHLFGEMIRLLGEHTQFYALLGRTAEEVYQRVMFLKDVIENKGGHRLFYRTGKPIRSEEDLQILYRLTWFASPSDVSREVNDGRGPADFKISRGSKDKTLVEMKLASNSQLKRNLKKQAAIYQKASDASIAYKVIVFFTASEENRVVRILKQLKLASDNHIILVDARNDNKPSGSRA
jgi:hypothetical protein